MGQNCEGDQGQNDTYQDAKRRKNNLENFINHYYGKSRSANDQCDFKIVECFHFADEDTLIVHFGSPDN